ncbi:MAG TPA: hypothetical protein VGX92_07450 [Pyrinomonadaceae bacterium]|jgi:hypothetical protein|nr:hypothetical protein [Pyrinomonadaceae bacterium]
MPPVLAPQAAAIRMIIALASVTDAVEIEPGSFDPSQCDLNVKPQNLLAGNFADLHIVNFQMDGLRENLAQLCPEIGDEIRTTTTFPMALDMVIQIAVNNLSALLLAAAAEVPPRWSGQCLSPDAPEDLLPNI